MPKGSGLGPGSGVPKVNKLEQVWGGLGRWGGIPMWESGAGPRASSPKVNKSKQVCSGHMYPFREQTDK